MASPFFRALKDSRAEICVQLSHREIYCLHTRASKFAGATLIPLPTILSLYKKKFCWINEISFISGREPTNMKSVYIIAMSIFIFNNNEAESNYIMFEISTQLDIPCTECSLYTFEWQDLNINWALRSATWHAPRFSYLRCKDTFFIRNDAKWDR